MTTCTVHTKETAPEKVEEARMQRLDLAKLRQEFNVASESVRLVAVFSPT